MNAKHQSPRNRKIVRSAGFTLIELLVVVAVIALLVSILLPSLSKARELARQSVCAAHMKGAGEALYLYTTEYDDWLPGPNTSGLHLTLNPNNYSENDRTDNSEPVQNMDWISPLLGESLGLPTNRRDRLVAILNNKMRCPTNQIRYGYEFAPSGDGGSFDIDPDEIYYSSYSAALAFHLAGPGAMPGTNAVRMAPEVAGRYRLPDGYFPRGERVGRSASKVFAAEGARYVNSADNVSFNAFMKQIRGGNFMLYGPMFPLNGDPYRFNWGAGGPGSSWELQPESYRFALRHSGKMNAVYYDGHVSPIHGEELTENEAAWFPAGTLKNTGGQWEEID